MIPLKRQLRGATDEKLAAHFAKAVADDTPQGRGAELQIIAELERRDRADLKRQERERARQARADTRAAKRLEIEAERERIRVDAEAKTQGYLVNRKGRTRGIDPDEILTGRQSVFERYASDEARDYFMSNPRPTAAYFRGQNTRVAPRASYR
jgi:DNA repair photolyase